ncbi:MAG: VOC family protein [Marinomonas atlantica]|nr:VOC family protein [Marinomonas atlantica]
MAPLKTTGIDHLNLTVKSLAESTQFYQQLLGFDVLEDMPDLDGAIIGNEYAKLALYEDVGLKVSENNGFSHMSFHVDDFNDIIPLCESLGIDIKFDGVVQWPQSRSIYIEDPNGYEIELAEVWGGGL